MSDVSLFLHGKLDPAEFVTKASADIVKATAWFSALPFAKTLEGWLIDRLYDRINAVLGPLVAATICHEIKVLLGIADPVVPPTP